MLVTQYRCHEITMSNINSFNTYFLSILNRIGLYGWKRVTILRWNLSFSCITTCIQYKVLNAIDRLHRKCSFTWLQVLHPPEKTGVPSVILSLIHSHYLSLPRKRRASHMKRFLFSLSVSCVATARVITYSPPPPLASTREKWRNRDRKNNPR